VRVRARHARLREELTMEHYKLLIGGELCDAADGARSESLDPGSGEVVATCARASAREAEQAVQAAAHAFESGVWSKLDPSERARVMKARR
jgi:acyl-CoA reductase-like NAD-dependent aldehyde dehydrogenase